ncbi:LysR family transcriptional regulator [Dactylosporangium sp. NPDC051485]|uniref:LysR family transcriptional regulator n=1 Tax=Dactylosporangium sp. NPDC051485 TaxID=3154846 RepID=UPI0034474EAE
MLDLSRLQALRAVQTFGTVTAAAGALHITPSAVSQHLAKLERETRTTLVEKDGRRLRLTEAGRVLAEHAGRVLAAVEEAEAALAAHQETVSGRLSVSSFPTACRGLLPHTLRRLSAEHPDLELTLLETDRDASFDGILRGIIDIALIDEWLEIPVTFPPGVANVELGLDVGDLMLPAGHPLAFGAGPITLEEVREERWIGSQPGTVCHEWLLRMLPGLQPSILVNEFETQLTFVAQGLGVAFVPRLARASLPAGVVARPVSPEAARRVSVAWRAAASGRPAIGATVAALQNAWRHRPSSAAPMSQLPEWVPGRDVIHVV